MDITETADAEPIKLVPKEIEFLQKIKTGDCLLKDGKPSKKIQSLIDRGYCRTVKARSGPLGIYTGDQLIRQTEAGTTVLALLELHKNQTTGSTQ